MELNEEELENVLGGANKEVVKEKVKENPNLYRMNRLLEIEKEKKDLLRQKEELLKNRKTR